MQPITDILFRSLVKAGFTTKGSDLTFLEEDTNKEIIIDNLGALIANAIGNISPYNAGTTYDVETFAQYVSYNQNIYLFIGTGPSTGVTPGTVPAATIWQLTTSGSLVHVQNTDIALGAGSPYYVTAAQLKDIYSSLIVSLTYAQAKDSVTVGQPGYNTLRKGYLYYIIDRGYFFTAIETNRLSREGWGLFKNPDFQNISGLFIGPWRSTMAGVALNKLCSWNGLMYKNITGVNGVSDPTVDTTNWQVQATTNPAYQTELDRICWDIENDYLLMRSDKRGNEIGGDSVFDYNDFNPVSLFQFGNDSVFDNKISTGNLQCINQRGLIIRVNVSGKASVTANNEDDSVINNVVICANCSLTLTRGNSTVLSDCNFSMGGVYMIDPANSFWDLRIDDLHSNYPESLDVTGLSTLNISSFSSDIQDRLRGAGQITLVSSNSSENISGGFTNVSLLRTNRIYTFFSSPTTGFTIAHTNNNKQNGALSITMASGTDSFIEYQNIGGGVLIEKTRGVF